MLEILLMLTLVTWYPQVVGTHFSDNQHWIEGLVSLMLSVQVTTC